MVNKGIYDNPNSVFHNRPDFVRPDSADDLVPTQVKAPARTFQGTATERAYAAITHAQNQYLSHVRTTAANKDRYSELNYKRQLAGFAATDAAGALDTAVGSMKDRVDQARAHVDKTRASLNKPGDAAQESRNTRYWNRTKPLLDKAGPGTLSVAMKFIERATPDELSVLLEELPSYLEVSRGPEDVQRAVAALDAQAQRSVPEYGRAVRQLGKAEKAATVVAHAATQLAGAITEGRETPIRMTLNSDYDPDK